MANWVTAIYDLSHTKMLLFLYERKTARYYQLLKDVVSSRSTLAVCLRDLRHLGLIQRRIKDQHPVQTEYILTEKGRKIAQRLAEIQEILKS